MSLSCLVARETPATAFLHAAAKIAARVRVNWASRAMFRVTIAQFDGATTSRAPRAAGLS